MFSGWGIRPTDDGGHSFARLFATLAIAPVALAAVSPATAQTAPTFEPRTPAGTTIVNVAQLQYGPPEARVTGNSNSVALRVDATLDVAIVAREQVFAADPAAATVAVAFDVTNNGNAPATYTLTADAAGRTLPVAADEDGDGAYDPARDTAARITLAPGQVGRAFAILAGPVTAEVRVTMTATDTRGIGTPGTVLPGGGPDGTDIVFGPSGGRATAASTITPGAASPALVKTQTVVAPDGSNAATTGAIVTYTLQARFPAPTRGVVIADPVPTGTTYVAGSITLDGAALTDAVAFSAGTVRVTLGDVAASAVRTIRFQTRIN